MDYGVELDLEKVTEFLEGSGYNPNRFLGVIYYLEDPKASFLISSSGKVNCVGAKNPNDSEKAIIKLTDKLKSAGVRPKKLTPVIEFVNVVVRADFGVKVSLEKLARSVDDAEYNPEVFPGLHLSVKTMKGDILLFRLGEGILHYPRKRT